MRARRFVVGLIVILSLGFAGVGLLHAEFGSLQAGIDRLFGKFAVADITERSLDGAPALAITFTEPLDTKQSYDRFVSVIEMPPRDADKVPRPEADADEEDCCGGGEGRGAAGSTQVSSEAADLETRGGRLAKGAWVLGDNPRILYFPHVRPQSRYVVHVKAELADARNNALAEERRVSVRTAAVSPAYYFASRGMVLPAKQNGGLPVVTVNVPEVDVQFLRIKNRELPKFLDMVIRGKPAPARPAEGEEEGEGHYEQRTTSLQGAIYNWDLDLLRTISSSVYLGRFTTEKRANRRAVTYLPVEDVRELQEPGVYVAVMSQPGRFRQEHQVTYFYVSDLALHLKLFEKSADAWVSSLTDGKAVTGVDVAWIDAQGKTLVSAKTDAEGLARFAEKPASARVVLARRDVGGSRQVSMVTLKEPALDLSEYEVSGHPWKPVRLFAWAGRDLYRPGEAFTLSALARDADGRPVPPQPIQAVLKQPDGKPLLTTSWAPDKRQPGYYQRQIELPADAATGFWNLELRADPADQTPSSVFRFGVEEFLPERMKLDLEAPKTPLDAAASLAISVKGTYLYGAPAAGNTLLGVVQFERNRNPLVAQLPGFEFGDSGEDAVRLREELPQALLDDAGLLQVSVPLAKLSKRRSPFNVRTTMSLLESGGRPVVRNIERVVWPAKKMIGVRPLFTGDYAREGSLAEFEVVRVEAGDNAGQARLLAGSGLPVRLFREDRNYYWRFDDQRGWHSGFTETDELVETTLTATPAGGRGKVAVPVRYGRYRLEVLDPETGQSLRYRFYAGWSARGDEAQGVRPDKVALTLDKPAYRAGDTAQLSIKPPHAGEVIITVEGGGALWTHRQAMPAEGGSVAIPVAAEWARHDLYVSVIALRPGNQGDRVTPTRAVGLVHLPLERAERKLSVSVEAPAKTLPGLSTKVKIRVAGAGGQNALVTLSAVDVGILNITRFVTPDPYRFYFGRQRYGADLHDVYGRLIEKMAGKKGRLKWGGDAQPKLSRGLPQKVQLVDLFSGPVLLDSRGEAEIPLQLPDFNGSLRLMAVVAAADRYGSAEREMTVAAPVVVELMTPRFLSFGDAATLALDVSNLSGSEQKLKVKLGGNSAVSVLDGERSLSLKDQQKQTLRFAVLAGHEHGLTELVLHLQTAAPTTMAAAAAVPATERRFPLMIQSPTPVQRSARRFVIEPGQSLLLREPELGGLAKSTVAAHLVLSDTPPIDVRSAVRGLLTYPYGCAEQTTSTAYPHVFVDEGVARQFGLRAYSRDERQKMLDRAIGRLSTMQNPQGGFSLWGSGSYDYWLSAYVTQFLQDARVAGFAPPDAMLGKAHDFLLRRLQEGSARLPAVLAPGNPSYGDAAETIDFDALVYGGYVLAREAKAPLSTLRQLFELRSQSRSGLPLVHLGLALRLMGDAARGRSAIDEGLARLVKGGPRHWGNYGSPLRDAAQAWVLLGAHAIDGDPVAGRDRLIDTLSAELAGQRWFSTQEQLALFLVGRELGAGSSGRSEWRAELLQSGKTQALAKRGALYSTLSADEAAAGVSVKNVHGRRLYAELVLSGFAASSLPPKNDPLRLTRTLYNVDGSPLGARSLKVGETVMVRLEASSSVAIGNGLVVDRVPAGLEIENRNLVQGEAMGGVKFDGFDPVQAMSDARIQHVEFRDDRFVAAVRLEARNHAASGRLQLFYRAKAVTPGRFVVPPLHAEDMYRPEVFGLTGGSERMSIVDAPAPGRAAETKP